MDDNMKVSSFVCAQAFNWLLGAFVGKGIMAGVKNTPGSYIPRLIILAMVNVSVCATSEKYAEWCYAVGDMFISSARKGWLWSKRKCLGKMLEDVYEDVRNK